MTELALDTAGAGCSVALRFGVPGAQTILQRNEQQDRGQSERVLELVQQLRDEGGVDYQSLNRIICTVGPGSFTGVRVGIALAKGFALASGASLFGISRSLVLGHKFISTPEGRVFDGAFASVLNAGRGGLYVQPFAVHSGVLEALSSAGLVSLDELAGFIEPFEIGRFVGLEGDVLPETFLQSNAENVVALTFLAEDLFSLEDRFFNRGAEVRPLYLRAPDAKPQVGKSLERRSL